ncbi:MAG: hypothetical protein M0O93_06165 [Bacteroidales bacterium]|nr:hypothetical protein [Bacteroidales bacterium]
MIHPYPTKMPSLQDFVWVNVILIATKMPSLRDSVWTYVTLIATKMPSLQDFVWVNVILIATKMPSLRDSCLGECNIDCYKDAIPTGFCLLII